MQARGFTLLEVLIAMAIFALIGVGANKMLRTIIDSRSLTQTRLEQISDLTRTLQYMEADLTQVVARKVRGEFGDLLDPLMVATGSYPLELTRAGWRNPAALKRSNLQRLAYELTADGELIRHFWLVLDRAEDSQPKTQRLLGQVTDFRVSVLDVDNNATEFWPVFTALTGQVGTPVVLLPRAIKISIGMEGIGEVSRIFNLVADSNPGWIRATTAGGK